MNINMERCRQRENTIPSFSSTLLDAIYRSIDESNGKGEEEKEVVLYREIMRKKNNNGFKEETSMEKACMIEEWMQEKVGYEKVSARRRSMADFDKIRAQNYSNKPSAMLLNSSSTSSESSCGGGFSSSESESFNGGLSSTKSSSSYSTVQRPKPIRTSVSTRPERFERTMDEIGMYRYNHQSTSTATQKAKNEGSFGKTKSRALKIYGDLKKVKQPISPGGRLASFLNSIFTAGNAKKTKVSSSKSEQTSTCSSASSFSRSCLSKTPSTRGNKFNNGTKRSVRFYPVSVIVDEDSRPCGHKNVYENNQEKSKENNILGTNNEELKFHIMKESRRVEEVARDLLKNYQKKKEEKLCFSDEDQELDDYDEDEDGASCASSDLFELDNLSAIGIDHQRYCQELPVYETTHLDTNRAIANGLIL